MQQLTASRLADFVGGRLICGDGSEQVGPDVVIDSRQVSPGALFVAIAGERYDGHDFLADVASAGAGAVLVSKEVELGIPTILVEDTVAGLSTLARNVVAVGRSGLLTTLAITGSSGKTSTKDLLAQILSASGETVAPPGSLNNEIGVPLTCCRVNERTRYLVSEMGARGLGHISWLTSIVPPDIALVLNVGAAHLGEFGGVAGTARAKGELVEALGPSGWAILNGDDPNVVAMASRCRGRIGWFGVGEEPKTPSELVVTAVDISLDGLGRPSFKLRLRRGTRVYEQQIFLDLVGRHHVANAAAAAAAAMAAGLDPEQIAQSLNGAKAVSDWRMSLTTRHDGVLVINDAYNANPDSMAAALSALGHVSASQRAIWPQGRAIAVLGDMLELGEESEKLHRMIGESLVVDELIAVGEFADQIVAGAASVGVVGKKLPKDEVAAALDLRAGDVVLLKASRGIGLETVAKQLLAGGHR